MAFFKVVGRNFKERELRNCKWSKDPKVGPRSNALNTQINLKPVYGESFSKFCEFRRESTRYAKEGKLHSLDTSK